MDKQPIKLMRIIARLNVGGPAVHCISLSSELSRFGYETVLVTGHPEIEEESYEKIFDVSRVGFRLLQLKSLRRTITLFGDLNTLFELIALMRRERPQIVHTHTAKAGLLGRLAAFIVGVPIVIHTFHGHVLSGYFSKPISQIFCLLERLLALRTTAIVTLSPALRDELSLKYKIAPLSKFRVIPLGRDISGFKDCSIRRGELRGELSLSKSDFVIGTLGRLVSIKDHRTLMKAFSLLGDPHTHLVIGGQGDLREELEGFAAELGILRNVHFLGWRADLDKIYADLDIFVLSSINEGTPLAIIESFASGCPVISTRVGGVSDMFHDFEPRFQAVATALYNKGVELKLEGALVESRNPEALSRAMRFFSENRPILEACAGSVQNSSKVYSLECLAQNIADLYRELLTSLPRSSENVATLQSDGIQ